MKIIKTGKLPEKKIITKTCTKCGSEIEFAESDLIFVGDDRRDGVFYYVNCPLCKQMIYV